MGVSAFIDCVLFSVVGVTSCSVALDDWRAEQRRRAFAGLGLAVLCISRALCVWGAA